MVHPTNGKLSYWYDQCEGFTSQLCKFKEHNILARPMMQWKDIYVGEMWMLDLRSSSIHLDKLGASDRQTQALNLFHLPSNYVDGSIKKKKRHWLMNLLKEYILNWELVKLHCAEWAMVIRLAISPSYVLTDSAKWRNIYPLNFIQMSK